MTHGSLFSGIGGFDIASEVVGWHNVFNCEIDNFCRRILKYYFPDVIQHKDITKTNFKQYANKIDIITGGFPCQPFSRAGKRKGTADERNLWSEMYRVVCEVEPKWVVAENVFGFLDIENGMVFEQMCIDLETSGYEVQSYNIPAAGINADHIRNRIWVVAYNKDKRQKQKRNNSKNIFTNTNGFGLEAWDKECKMDGNSICKRKKNTQFRGQFKRFDSKWFYTNERERAKRKQFVESPVYCRDDELSTRLDGITLSKLREKSIKAYGNAIYVPIAVNIFKAIIQFENKQ